MVTGIVYQWKLAGLERKRRSQMQHYESQIAEAKKARQPQFDIDLLKDEAWNELDVINDDINALRTSRLISLANKQLLPLPDSADWYQSESTGKRLLTREAMVKLRDAIRKDKKERRELLLMWVVPVSGALIAIIGAISGLVAVAK